MTGSIYFDGITPVIEIKINIAMRAVKKFIITPAISTTNLLNAGFV